MMLKKMTLTDFGVYCGKNEFDFSTKESQPVVLFGGKNGAGKTTLFESVSLCLYGKDAIEPRITQKQYRDKMRRLFHMYHGTSKRAEETSISLEFLYSHRNTTTAYKITRMWQNDGDATESLHVYKKEQNDEDYVSLDSMEQALWQTFIDRLLPKNITKLFFFDGEQIKHIAKFGKEDIHIKSSFDALLGLDIVDQLHDDIGLHMLRNSDGGTKKMMEELDTKTAEKEKCEKKITEYVEKRVYLIGDVERRRKQITTDEEKFLKLGGQFAKDRAELIEKSGSLESSLDAQKKEIQAICSDTLPLCLIPEQLAEVRKDLVSDSHHIQSTIKKEILSDAYNRFNGAIQNTISKYDKSIQSDISDGLDGAMAEILKDIPDVEKTAFNLSAEDIQKMIRLIDSVLKYDREDIKNITERYDTIQADLDRTKSSLDVAPQQDEIAPVFSKIAQANREIGEMEGEIGRLEDLEAQERSMMVMLNSQLRQTLAGQKIDKKRLAGLEMAPAVQDALQDYSKRLRIQKVKLLEANILNGMRRLFHKSGLVKNIEIDPETFEITMYRGDNEIVTREMMSQGELQTYATAIVWGLAKTSGRPLPFIIDTPLARLDMEHRDNLLENFYPCASHQTIIFTTDAEIYGPYYEKIKSDVSRSMLVIYDAQSGKSVQKAGYFDKEAKICEVG